MTTLAKTPVQAKPQETKDVKVYIVKTDAAQGIIDAVVNVFGIVDLGDDIIHNGAYTKTLNERGNKVKVRVLDSHKTDSIMRVIGKPLEIREIGRDELFSLSPDVKAKHPEATGGLFTRTQFLMDTPEGEGAFKRLASGAIDEWSIALDPLDVEYGKVTVEGKDRSVRHIRQIRLYEYSPVIWGMNQATVTTDVKSEPDKTEPVPAAPVQDKTTVPPDTKQATLGSRLEANLRMSAAFCISDWLGEGVITVDETDALNTAVTDAMTSLRAALPSAVADKPLVSYWGADEAGEHKAGRMISAANRGKIQSAIDALQALLDADMPASESETQDEKSLTGSGAAVDETPTTPSIPEPSEPSSPEQVALAADQIDRELTELQLLMAVA